MKQLIDLGERRIIQEIIPKYVSKCGSDCAIVEEGEFCFALTSDPVPIPGAKVIAGDNDFYWMGWLLVTINASDLAASGARPNSFLAALEFPSEFKVVDFERFLLGIKESCENEGLEYVGGNIKESKNVIGVGFALGLCEKGFALNRIGGTDGDFVISIGQGGRFWRDSLSLLEKNIKIDKEKSPLFKPKSQIKIMQELGQKRLIKSCMDNSDGLIPTLMELSRQNSKRIIIELNKLIVPNLDKQSSIIPSRLWLGWGDWNIIAIIDKESLPEIEKCCQKSGSGIFHIGVIKNGDIGVTLKGENEEADAPRLESERFSSDSWFSSGIQGYIEQLKNVKLPK